MKFSLQTDQVDVRIKALNLIGKLLSLPGNHVAKDYRYLFMEFLNRLSDKSAEVRLNALSHAKTLYIANVLGTESSEVLSKLPKLKHLVSISLSMSCSIIS